MEVGDIAEATLMAIATAPDKRVALELLHTLCREHAISDGAPICHNISLFLFSAVISGEMWIVRYKALRAQLQKIHHEKNFGNW